jgi:hypothetical protein
VMTRSQRSYWSHRSPALRSGRATRASENWSGFNRRNATSSRRRTHG